MNKQSILLLALTLLSIFGLSACAGEKIEKTASASSIPHESLITNDQNKKLLKNKTK